MRGLSTLEPDPERQLKYVDFIDVYSALDDNERERYEREYQQEAKIMSTFFQRVREESAREGELRGEQRGEQRGKQRGEALVLLRQMRLKFGDVPEDIQHRIEQTDADTLLTWSERILTAERAEDVIR